MTSLEKSAGAIIICTTTTPPQVLTIEYTNGKSGFPKGHILPGETVEQAAHREIKEETGLEDLTFIKCLGTIHRQPKTISGKSLSKDIVMFLSLVDVYQHQKAKEKCNWQPIDRIADSLNYREDRDFFNKVIESIKNSIETTEEA
ncbi:MAG: NUDIX domain-containing protein [Candidatus Uhrbacteria bacterium]|nr:NUDIX domain-containing protein [Patescibacteria group bacterium]MBU1906954.1 NUDIX domain-containing protein [Patescibacteria group bacterium]